ncbi:hypothetical protein FSW04_21180 [Baekduia soli]|uniref:FAD/NAD(P)-binding domain-containing protein n=1 Tax=Baekduia soli TaxID=496014 RepID=A0A5B8U9S6_9ACTN|nr:FAD-dependent oxidoreductase [Baekduia soli]QEC49830.1 hypothetical protein FSW04_21180 [Baekduia soli]
MTDRVHPVSHQPLKVAVVGGGVGALETVLALQDLAPGLVVPVLVSATDEFVYRPMLVGEPFGLGPARHYRLAELCTELGVELVMDRVVEVDGQAHHVRTAHGTTIGYDALVLAAGANPYAAFEHGVTFERQVSPEDFDEVLADLTDGLAPHVAVVVPDGVTWTLPAYELAMLTAAWGERCHPDEVTVTIFTPEPMPLDVFGATVSAAVTDLLEAERIGVRCGVHPDIVTSTSLRVGGGWRAADRIVSLPLLTGPRLPGVPSDEHGFVPVDGFGAVRGLPDVYAAGDSTDFPIKQGGLAAQQAGVVAAHIAARAGADVAPQALEPVLRGLLITRQGPRFLRAELRDVDGTSELSAEPLWWPPSKIASRWLGPHLARLDADEAAAPTAPAG